MLAESNLLLILLIFLNIFTDFFGGGWDLLVLRDICCVME